jgi:hypothetical protein
MTSAVSRSNLVDNFHVTLVGISSSHFFQHVVISRLKGHVEAFAYLLQGRHGINDAIGKVARMRRDVANAGIVGDVIVQVMQEVGKGPFGDHVSSIGVNVLSQQRHFLVALILNQIEAFLQNVFHTARLFHAAGCVCVLCRIEEEEEKVVGQTR